MKYKPQPTILSWTQLVFLATFATTLSGFTMYPSAPWVWGDATTINDILFPTVPFYNPGYNHFQPPKPLPPPAWEAVRDDPSTSTTTTVPPPSLTSPPTKPPIELNYPGIHITCIFCNLITPFGNQSSYGNSSSTSSSVGINNGTISIPQPHVSRGVISSKRWTWFSALLAGLITLLGIL